MKVWLHNGSGYKRPEQLLKFLIKLVDDMLQNG